MFTLDFWGKYGNAGEIGRDFSLPKRVGDEGQMQESPAECGRVGNYVYVDLGLATVSFEKIDSLVYHVKMLSHNYFRSYF